MPMSSCAHEWRVAGFSGTEVLSGSLPHRGIVLASEAVPCTCAALCAEGLAHVQPCAPRAMAGVCIHGVRFAVLPLPLPGRAPAME